MDTARAVRALAALAQGSRLEVFRRLVQAGANGLAAGEIRERVGIPATTLSFHLSQLTHADLVGSRREGRSVIYAANYGAMGSLLRFMTQNCCQAPAGASRARVAVRKKKRS